MVAGIIEDVPMPLAAVNDDVTLLDGVVNVRFSRSADVVCKLVEDGVVLDIICLEVLEFVFFIEEDNVFSEKNVDDITVMTVIVVWRVVVPEKKYRQLRFFYPTIADLFDSIRPCRVYYSYLRQAKMQKAAIVSNNSCRVIKFALFIK